MHTLIVDDVFIIRKMLITMLAEYGPCDVAESGEEAIALFESALKTLPYDLICLDILMPRTDGLKVLENVRRIEKVNNIPSSRSVKIIMVTTLCDPDSVKTSVELGCDEYIAKPVKALKFRQKLKKLELI